MNKVKQVDPQFVVRFNPEVLRKCSWPMSEVEISILIIYEQKRSIAFL